MDEAGGPFEYQRAGASADARSERCAGRAAQRHPLRTFAVRAEAFENRHAALGQELHHDAGQRSG